MRIETERLFLYPLSPEQLRQAQRNIPAVCEALGLKLDGNFGFCETLRKRRVYAAKESILDLYPSAFLLTTAFYIQEKKSGCMIGEAGFKGPPNAGAVEIGYGIRPPARGQGYMTEAVSILCRAAKAQTAYPVKAVVAKTLPGNRASQRVLEKNGFVRAGDAGKYYKFILLL